MRLGQLTGPLAVGFIVAWTICGLDADDASTGRQQAKPVKLPGMLIDRAQGCVDLEATVCLDNGFLELVACTKGSKEHESIVVIDSQPVHLHTALLLLGANNGNPAMRKQVGEKQKRWVNIPPRGDPVDVFLVVKDATGKRVERPISDFIVRAQHPGEEFAVGQNGAEEDETKPGNNAARKFPHTFLFAGSHLLDKKPGTRQYLADLSGHVISIATFGDAVLCLPSVHSKANGALEWQVNAKHLPDVGTKVVLRLRPRQKKPRRGADKSNTTSNQVQGKKDSP